MNKNYLLILIPCTLLFACSSPKDEFIDGCTSEGAPKSICSCTYEKLEAEFGQEYLERVNNFQEPISEMFLQTMVRAGRQCMR